MYDFLTTIIPFAGLMALGFTAFAYFNNQRLDRLKNEAQAAKAERDAFEKRLIAVEDVDKTALPEFLELKKEHKHLSDTVKIYHEQRIEGIVKDAERQRDLFNMKFENNDREFKEIKDCIKEIKEDFKKNTDKILDKLEKINSK